MNIRHIKGVLSSPAAGGTEPPRCLGCGYILHGLPEPRCPECGRNFDPEDPDTFSAIAPLVRWKFWLPAVVSAGSISLVLYILLGLPGMMILGVPICLGVILGYAFRFETIMRPILVLVVLFVLAILHGVLNLFLFLMVTSSFVVVILIGVFAGTWLRNALRLRNWGQRGHLPKS